MGIDKAGHNHFAIEAAVERASLFVVQLRRDSESPLQQYGHWLLPRRLPLAGPVPW